MRKIFFVVISLICLTANYSVYAQAGYGTFSEGKRIGEISKFSVKGLMFKSGEGELLMGSESVPLIITTTDSEGNESKKQVNPWQFSSTNPEIQKQLSDLVGEYAVLTYEQAKVKGVKTDTDYEIISVDVITGPIDETCVAQEFIQGRKSEGKRSGRIVKVSEKGHMSKSFEVTMQVGNSGNQFHEMSISEDRDMFDCVMRFLQAGQKVTVEYSQSHINLNILGRDTTYEIVKVSPQVSGLN